jgi:hypothetical protein
MTPVRRRIANSQNERVGRIPEIFLRESPIQWSHEPWIDLCGTCSPIPFELMELMKHYPQPIQQSGVEYLPVDISRQ